MGLGEMDSRRTGWLTRWVDCRLVPAGLLSCLAIAIAMALLRPIPHGHSYGLAVKVTAVVTLVWFVVRHQPGWIEQRWFLGLVMLGGVYLMIERPLTLPRHPEIVAVYQDVLAAVSRGENPYTCDCIVHYDEHGEHQYGGFNYPPAEIWPYWLARAVAGTFDWRVLATTLLLLQLLACFILYQTFAEFGFWRLTPYLSIVAFYELRTNVAQTLLILSLLVLVLTSKARAPRLWHRPALWLLFGLGLVTKFLVIPVFAAYVWHRLVKGGRKRLLSTLCDAGMPLVVSAACTIPFGLVAVFRETVLFNLLLHRRAPLTTFYPNVLSGPMTWLGITDAYSVVAVLALAFAVLAAPWMKLYSAMLCAAIVFLLVSPTPEPQYVPAIVILALASVLDGSSSQGSTLPTSVGWRH